MKFRSVVLGALILVASLAAFAKMNPPRHLFLDRDITVNGVNVPRGTYALSLETHGVSVHAALWKDGRFIVSAHGSWVRHGVIYREDAVLLQVNSDGTRSLMEIRLAGSAKTIVLDNESPVLHVAPAPNAGNAAASGWVQD